MSEPLVTIRVSSCLDPLSQDNCPFLGESQEEARCNLAKNQPLGWNAELCKQRPDWCPLRKGAITVEETKEENPR